MEVVAEAKERRERRRGVRGDVLAGADLRDLDDFTSLA